VSQRIADSVEIDAVVGHRQLLHASKHKRDIKFPPRLRQHAFAHVEADHVGIFALNRQRLSRDRAGADGSIENPHTGLKPRPLQ
jgi:hypothetical protein